MDTFLLTAVLRRTIFSMLKSVGIRWTTGGIRRTLYCWNKLDTFSGSKICWNKADTFSGSKMCWNKADTILL